MTELRIDQVSRTFPARQGNAPTRALEPTNLDVGNNDFVTILGPSGCGKSTLLRIIAGLDHPTSALSRFLEIYDTRLVNHTRVYDGILDALHLARRQARLGVLTNKPLGPTKKLLDAFAISDLFECVIGGDGPYPRKPNPEGLFAMMTSTGVARERTLLVGDSGIDYETAQRASVRCCIVAYGFGFRTFSRDRVEGGNAVVDDAAGLRDVIQQFLRS